MNKIKGSSSAVKMKYLLFVFAAAVLVCLPARVYQLLALVDATNGFFKESDVTVPVLYAVVVVFGLLFLVLSFISKEVPSPKLPTGKNVVLGAASFVITAGFGYDMFNVLSNVLPANQGNAAIFMSLLKSNLADNGGTFALLRFVLAFFAVVYFIVFGLSHLNGKASYKEFKLLALSPLCWSMSVLVIKLMNAISFIKVSELLFEIFMFVFAMLFFLTFARISSGVFTEDSMWGIYGYGLVASLLGAIVTIPRIVMSVVGLAAVEGYGFNFAHLAIVVFILAYVFASLGVGFKDGLINRKTVNELDLPDDFEAVIKSDDLNTFFADDEDDDEEIEAEAETVEAVEEPVKGFAISFETEAVEDIVEAEDAEAIEEIVEEATEEILPVADEVVEEPAEAVEEDVVEEIVEETAEEVAEVAEEAAEDAVEEPADEVAEVVIEDAADAAAEEAVEAEEKSEDDLGIVSLADLLKRKQENKD